MSFEVITRPFPSNSDRGGVFADTDNAMEYYAQAWAVGKWIARAAFRLASRVAIGFGRYVTTKAQHYITSWNSDGSVKRQSLERSPNRTSPPRKRSPINKKAQEATEPRIDRMVSHSLNSKRMLDTQKPRQLSAPSPTYSQHRRHHSGKRRDSSSRSEQQTSFEEHLTQSTHASPQYLFSSSPLMGTPDISKDSLEESTSAIPAPDASSPLADKGQPPPVQDTLTVSKTANSLFGKFSEETRSSATSQASSTRTYNSYIDDEEHLLHRDDLAKSNNLMSQFHGPTGVRAISNGAGRKKRRDRKKTKHATKDKKKKEIPLKADIERTLRRIRHAQLKRAQMEKIHPRAGPLATGEETPERIESQEMSHLDDAPPKATKQVRWDTTAFASPSVQPKVKYYIKNEAMSYPANERLGSAFRTPRKTKPEIGDDFSLLNEEDSLLGTPIACVFEKYESPEPVAHEATELKTLREGLDKFHVSEKYAKEQELRRKAAAEREKKEEAERKARAAKAKADREAAEKKAREAEEARIRAEREAAEKAEKARLAALEAARAAQKLVKPLTEKWSARVDKAMATPSKSSILATARGIELSRKDFGTLLPARNGNDGIGWLNDEIVNAYVGSAVDRVLEKEGFDRKRGTPPPMHAFNTNWYNTVSTKGVQAVARWSKRAKLEGAKLLQVEQILFPINDSSHWTLLAVSGTRKRIWYLDSLGGVSITGGKNKYVNAAREWLRMELKEKYVEDEWELMQGRPSPMQNNGVDCGVFTCFNAVAVVRGLVPEDVYGAVDMNEGRRMIAGTLIGGGFHGVFDWEDGVEMNGKEEEEDDDDGGEEEDD